MTEDKLLNDLKEKNRNRLGRYTLTKFHRDNGEIRSGTRTLRFGLWNRPKISLKGATTYVVPAEYVGKIALISYLVFGGDLSLWWAIASVNNIKNPLTDMEAGQILIIPTLDAVQSSLSSLKEGDY